MSDRLFVATRKGLFTLSRKSGNWSLNNPEFLGDPVTNILHDARDGTLYATLNLGHFGVKMRRSKDSGKTWEEHAVPSYPPQPESAPKDPAWKLVQVWSLETGGNGRTARALGWHDTGRTVSLDRWRRLVVARDIALESSVAH